MLTSGWRDFSAHAASTGLICSMNRFCNCTQTRRYIRVRARLATPAERAAAAQQRSRSNSHANDANEPVASTQSVAGVAGPAAAPHTHDAKQDRASLGRAASTLAQQHAHTRGEDVRERAAGPPARIHCRRRETAHKKMGKYSFASRPGRRVLQGAELRLASTSTLPRGLPQHQGHEAAQGQGVLLEDVLQFKQAVAFTKFTGGCRRTRAGQAPQRRGLHLPLAPEGDQDCLGSPQKRGGERRDERPRLSTGSPSATLAS